MLFPLGIDGQYHTQISPYCRIQEPVRENRKKDGVCTSSFLTHLPQRLDLSSPSKVDLMDDVISSVSPNYLPDTPEGLNPLNEELRLSFPR